MRRVYAGWNRAGFWCFAAALGLAAGSCMGSSPRLSGDGETEAGRGGQSNANDDDNTQGDAGATSHSSSGGAHVADAAGEPAAGSGAEDGSGEAGALSKPDAPDGGTSGGAGGKRAVAEGGTSNTTGGKGNAGTGDDESVTGVCDSDNDCRDAGLLCDTSRHLCVSCVEGADCAEDAQCVQGVCEPKCINSLDCAAGMVCDRTAARCVRCVTAEDCGGNQLCGVNRCWDPCASDNTCTPQGLLCDTEAGHCAQCLYDVDCGDQARCAQGLCEPLVCSPNQARCSGDRMVTCNATGNGYLEPIDCGEAGCAETEGTALCGLVGAGGAGSVDECLTSGGDYCALVPRFFGTQVVDGIGDEFCNVPPLTLAIATAPYVNPGYSAELPTVAVLRAAWSDEAFHAHVVVHDPAVYPDSGDQLWGGDNVQFFVAGTRNLTGEYLGSEDGGATHIIVAPPASADDAARAIQLFESSGGNVYTDTLSSDVYAARLVEGGYEVELRLPWSQYADHIPSGGRMGFDFVVGAQDTDGNGLELEGGLINNEVSSSSCASTWTHPGCDDRTWCTPALQ